MSLRPQLEGASSALDLAFVLDLLGEGLQCPVFLFSHIAV
jgi:hypothetical protein